LARDTVRGTNPATIREADRPPDAVDTTTAEKAVIGSLLVLVSTGAIVWMRRRRRHSARSI
jgi:hypothetical protein